MKIIDVHTHVFPEGLAPRAIESLSVPGRHHAHYDGTTSGLLSSMQQHGIDISWTVPVATKASQVASINTFAAAQPRERLVPFGGIHPDTEDAYSVLATFKGLGLSGFKIHPDYQHVSPLDPRMEPIYTAAVDFDLMAFFHAGDDVGPRTAYASPDVMAMVIESYPTMRLHLAHLGAWNMWDAVEEHLVGKDVTFDTAYVLGHIDDAQFMRIVRTHGIERILFGSDGPWVNPTVDIAHLAHLDLSGSELDAIMHRNAERCMAGL